MTKYIGTMIAWILAAGLLLYFVQHGSDMVRGFSYLVKGNDINGFVRSINAFFK